jgi:hypothetical protein
MRALTLKESFLSKSEKVSNLINELPEVIENNKLVHKYYSGDVSKILNLIPSDDIKKIVNNAIRDLEEKYIELYTLGKNINSEEIINPINSIMSREFSYMSRTESMPNHFDNLRKSLNYLGNYGECIDFLQSQTLKTTYEVFKKIGVQLINPKKDGKVINCLLSTRVPDEQYGKICEKIKTIDPKYGIETSHVGGQNAIENGHIFLYFYFRKQL